MSPDLLNQFDVLLGSAPIGAYLVDDKLCIRAANAIAWPIFGDVEGGFIGRDYDEIIRRIWKPEVADDVVRRFRHTLATGETYVAPRLSDERADRGVVEAYEWQVNRVAMPGGGYGVVCYFTDVTAKAAGEQAAKRLASIVASSDDAIISKNLDGTIVSWNRGAERLFGYPPEEAIGKSITMLIPPDRQNEEPAIIERIRRGERVDHYETIRQRKDGALIDISLTVSPVLDSAGTVIGASKIARDIGVRKQAEATRNLLLSELNHRVKNTLAVVQAIVQQTLWSTKDPADFANRFSGRIQSLARVHSLLTETTWQGADLRTLIRDQLLHGSVDETKLTAWGPAVQLASQTALHVAMMLHELGTNSAKHGALSSTSGWVTVNWSVKGETLHLTWEERGGPPVVAPTTRGFGTRLIEQSAKSEGGRAQVHYEAKGVTWEITLPLPQSPSIKASPEGGEAEMVNASRPLDGAPAKERPILDGRRLLVVEDEPLISLAIVATLEIGGAQSVRAVGTEKEALGAIEQGGFDTALLDANLHGHPVGEIAAALTRKGVPFVFVTGYGRESLPEPFRQVPIIGKPFSDKELLEAVAKLGSRGAEVVRLTS